jgi:osmotically inducible protein OsmC
MTIRSSTAVWNGTLKDGAGTMKVGNGAYEGPYTYVSRFETGSGTNPEELIGAAHAGCYSMFLSALLTKAGFTPTSISTEAKVHLTEGPTISLIELTTIAVVPGVSPEVFQGIALEAKAKCPVSKVLSGAEITLNATLA